MDNHQERYIDGAISNELFRKLVHTEKLAELGRMSAGVAHELNAPLSVIAAASQMILREADMPESAREMVERISIEALRLSQLTKGILNFSSQEDDSADTDINLVVGFVLDFLAFEASTRAVSIKRNLDYRLPLITLNPNQFKQVLFNVIMNALQAMEDSNDAQLTVETMADSDNAINVIISDNGCGIAREHLSSIFHPYFSTRKSNQGTGLGLFLTKRLVENMGGRIEVLSRQGYGTTFTLAFPIE
ncbi:MAG TPA: ATP-binding protein [Deltaproteobacteria bacterium]|nr:ATP-binding protein [Deltaproteobacteria bacterium]HQB39073.1 ATP-binding protein [Deltaproteobacteria bacterium]